MDISLRKKRTVGRPKISAPQQISSSALEKVGERRPQLPDILTSSSLSVPRERSQAQGNSADYVKRRYSTKLTQLPKESNTPSVPGIPNRYQSRSPARNTPKGNSFGGEKIAVDLAALQRSDLQTDQCEPSRFAPALCPFNVNQMLHNSWPMPQNKISRNIKQS